MYQPNPLPRAQSASSLTYHSSQYPRPPLSPSAYPPPTSYSHPSSPPPPISEKEDDLINNILPSYHMFQSTVSKNLTLTDENFNVEPPMYEMTPVTSATPTILSVSDLISPTESSNNSVDHFPFPSIPEESEYQNHHHQHPIDPNDESTFNQDSAEIWENTILANVHKLSNISKLKNSPTADLDINITVTEKICQKGIKPTIIDISDKEFKQGDYIHGYVTIINKSDKPIPFDMVYVVFEGTLTILDNNNGVLDTSKPLSVFKFLNMLDLFASWSYANIDRLVTDNGDPHDWCDGETDPYDNTVLSIDVKRLFQPNVTYKRFFTFKVPDKLLDDICEDHGLIRHCDLPPSLGISRNSLPASVLMAHKESRIRDLTFIDSAITYSVDARIIGRSHDYNYLMEERDRYIIAKDAVCPIRVIPTNNEDIYNKKAIYEESKLFYKAFHDLIKEKVDFAEDLLNVSTQSRGGLFNLTPQSSRDSLTPSISNSNGNIHKLRQLYQIADINYLNENVKLKKSDHKQFDDDYYQYLLPFKKKSLTGNVKILGVLSLSSPKTIYSVDYIPPIKFRDPAKTYSTQITIPLELSYVIESLGGSGSSSGLGSSSKVQFPEIKSLHVELVVLTIKSKKYPIPIEFNHDLCFKDREISSSKNQEIDNFDNIVTKQYNTYVTKISHIIKTLGNDLIKFETKLYKDIRALSQLQTKYINLSIVDFDLFSRHDNTSLGLQKSIKTIPWEHETISNSTTSTVNNHSLYSKKFEIKLDLSNCHLKGMEALHNQAGFDYLTLVPNFQTCLISRLYYFKITVKLMNGESLIVNVPLSIERN
ncbi:BUL1-like protein [Scheffersomyces coipomensis]|uniref:BUL1-like protein n=1 Tax=Scheffersomyces coipomensis TaxID=1788519 RepID=UPI00315DC59E